MKPSVEKLALLRAALLNNSIDVYIIILSDPHLGENIPDYWRIIEWLTGFSGSAATVVVTNTFAGLWTDSRYLIQAEKQLSGSGFELVMPGTFNGDDYTDFILETAAEGSRVAFDGRILSVSKSRILANKLKDKQPVLVTDFDPVTGLWDNRPGFLTSPAFDHPVKYCGKEREDKINEVRAIMMEKKADYHFLSAVDDIMWLLNIRGADVRFSPLLLSFVLIGRDQILFFTDENKVPPNLAREFDRIGIVILPYEETIDIVQAVTAGFSVLINPASTSVAMYNAIIEKAVILEGVNIPSELKAIKNKTEIKNIGEVMVKDGIALTKFFFWLESNSGKIKMSESSLAAKIFEFRSQQIDFLGPSFETIAAFNENSAIPHYAPEADKGSDITERGILLIDSGGQYMGGTTDITRTIPVGIPTSQQRRDFTLILKGHIDLARSKFPEGTNGYQLDTIARRPLWGSGLNFGHGTGHGVGFCLNVHEGPQSISPSANKTAFRAGMVTSNEPALYREGEYGIRTENLILCYEDEETEFGQFLKFDTVSLCYIDKALIDKSLLDREQIEWLNRYHSDVYEKLGPYLTTEERAWLREKTDSL